MAYSLLVFSSFGGGKSGRRRSEKVQRESETPCELLPEGIDSSACFAPVSAKKKKKDFRFSELAFSITLI
jgi:hypothetical protein